MNEKIKEEIKKVINPLKKEWNAKTEKQLEVLLKEFGNICRSETSTFRNQALSDIFLAEVLIEIGEKYDKNSKILIEIVSAIDNMHSRYGLRITEEIFEFLIEQTKNKKVNFYVSIFITDLPQFVNYIHKWEYIMSIPKISPTDKSRNTFYRVINEKLVNIPNHLKIDIVEIFKSYLENESLHQTTKSKYLELIDSLKKSV